METTKRFEVTLTKLYNAFHKGELDAIDCEHCAVGNMCDNTRAWISPTLVPWGHVGRINPNFDNKTGYSAAELATIECVFLYGKRTEEEKTLFNNTISKYNIEYGHYTKEEQKERQFLGLCAVVEYLSELDNISNPMDYTKLFEREENDTPKYELTFN